MARKTKFIMLYTKNLTEHEIHEIKEKLETQDEISTNDWPNSLKRGIMFVIVTQKDEEPVIVLKILEDLEEKDIIPLFKRILLNLQEFLKKNAVDIAIKIYEIISRQVS